MDERRSLALLGWTVGGIVGLMFTLNGIALALTQGGPSTARLAVAHASSSFEATMNMAPSAKPKRS
ncbi:MAG: hypothetical protein WAV27_03880 [Xanthobacteraceae bacterium]